METTGKQKAGIKDTQEATEVCFSVAGLLSLYYLLICTFKIFFSHRGYNFSPKDVIGRKSE